MESPESFLLPVMFKGEERMMAAELSTFGYIHRINIDVDGVPVFFEPDEERNYRAVLADPTINSKLDAGLMAAIIQSLEDNFKG